MGEDPVVALVPSEADNQTRWTVYERRHLDAARAWQERDCKTLVQMVRAHMALRLGGRLRQGAWINYINGAPRFFRWMWDHCPGLNPTSDLGRLMVTDMLRGEFTPTTKTPAVATCENLLKVARSCAATMVWCGLWNADMFADVSLRDPVPDHEKREPFTPEEVMRILAVIQDDWLSEILVRLGLDAGLRSSEIQGVRWQDVDLENKLIQVVDGKGGKPRRVYFGTGPLYRVLADNYLRPPANDVECDPGDTIIPGKSFDSLSHSIFKKAGVKFSLHKLRHTCARDLLVLGGSLEAVQRHLGHSSIKTTQIYAQMAAVDYHAAVDKKESLSNGRKAPRTATASTARGGNWGRKRTQPVNADPGDVSTQYWPRPSMLSSSGTYEAGHTT